MASDHQERCIKKRRIDDHGGSCCSITGSLESLPREIIADILSRLPITSLVQLRFVCRSWRLLTQDSLLLTAHLSSSSSSSSSPCLLLHHDSPIRNELYFLDLSSQGSKDDHRVVPKTKKFRLRFTAAMPEFEVVGSCNGLLCLLDSLYHDTVYIYNPFTRNCIELPESSMKYHDQELVFGFGFHPRTKEYKVVKIVYYRSNSSSSSSSSNRASRTRSRVQYKQSEVQILTLGKTDSLSWRSLGKAPYKFMKLSSEALVKGRLHFVTRPRRYVSNGKFISFDLADEEFREIPKPDSGGLNRSNNRLVNLKGCLCAIVHGNYGKLDIWVMKTYEVKESWTREYSIGAYVPKRLKQNLDRPILPRRNAEKGKVVRVLCILQNGEILLEYKNRVLVSYDPNKGKFNDLVFDRLPNWFHTVVHVGTLCWFDIPFDV